MSILFSCYWCGFSEEYNTPPTECPKCASKSYTLNYNKKQKSKMSQCFEDHPRWSDALGCSPSQVKDFQKKWPWMTFDNEGRCLIKNRQDKLRHLKAREYAELD